jgi:hypothetical protein
MAGFNTEISHKGETFHVQTQDNGLSVKSIESIIYKSGRVLTSRKASYYSILNSPDFRTRLEQMLEEQHQRILDDIKAGRFDHL